MTWRAIYNTSDGRLRSVGSRWTDPPKPGTAFIESAKRPDQGGNMWDAATRSWVPRPPKILVDRVGDLETHPSFSQFQDVFDPLSDPDKTKVRDTLRKLLGSEQFRNVSESVEIGK